MSLTRPQDRIVKLEGARLPPHTVARTRHNGVEVVATALHARRGLRGGTVHGSPVGAHTIAIQKSFGFFFGEGSATAQRPIDRAFEKESLQIVEDL